MVINLLNIEELIFFDKKIHFLFPEFQNLFNQWSISYSSLGLQDFRRKSILDLLNSLETQHISKLEEYFKEKIVLDKIDYHFVKNVNFSNLNVENLCQFNDYKNFCFFRGKEEIKLTFWR